MLSKGHSRSTGAFWRLSDRNQRATTRSQGSPTLCCSTSSAAAKRQKPININAAPLSAALSLRSGTIQALAARPGAELQSLPTRLTANARGVRSRRGARAKRSAIVAAAAAAAAAASSSAEPPPRLTQAAEASRYCYEDLVLFLLAVDCDAQLNRALTKEEYELAAAVRERRAKIDEALEALRAARDLLPTRGSGGASSSPSSAPAPSSASSSSSDQIDAALEGVRLRSELAAAIEAEDYAAASALRDRIKGVEERLAAAAGAAALRAERAGAPPRLRLGARVLHAELGYRGAVAGWDACCLETPEWQRGARIGGNGGGEEGNNAADPFQPFYHVLVDARDWRGPEDSPPLSYVPQSRLVWPEDPECWLTWGELDARGSSGGGSSGSGAPRSPFLASGAADERELLHPYSYLLYLGQDERGDMIPTKALRERYSQPRVDVFPPPSRSGDGGGEDEE